MAGDERVVKLRRADSYVRALATEQGEPQLGFANDPGELPTLVDLRGLSPRVALDLEMLMHATLQRAQADTLAYAAMLQAEGDDEG